MMCFKHIVPYALLLPIPSASPIFILIFAIQIFYTVRPCGYCLALMSILFLSTSPASPFTSASLPPSSEAEVALNLDPSLTKPIRKTWFDLNHGYLFDPVLYAFTPNATTTEAYVLDNDEREGRLPQDHMDLRWKGLGMILDFGWTRSDQGLQWELEDRRLAGSRLKSVSQIELERIQAEKEREQEKMKEAVKLDRSTSWLGRVLSTVRGRGGGGSASGLLGDW